MATPKPKTILTVHLEGACPTHSRTEVAGRDIKSIIDEPLERDGSNLGHTPVETLLGALIGCTNVIGHKVAKMHGVDITALAIDVEAQFDRRGVTLAEEIDIPFPSLKLFIDLTTTSDGASVDKLKQDLQRFCPVSKVIRQSGTEIEEIWTVSHP
ncbi:MAG: OsmC family protein [Rhodospirillaceae bacterium]|nr:OsmC family protein [Rhodospirillaceae bacterium]